MKKMILSAMMIMAMVCTTTTANAQSDKCQKAKKECCDKKKAEKKDCCKKDAEKKAGCGADCKKCTECKATCADTNCKDCTHKGQCKKNCKK